MRGSMDGRRLSQDSGSNSYSATRRNRARPSFSLHSSSEYMADLRIAHPPFERSICSQTVRVKDTAEVQS